MPLGGSSRSNARRPFPSSTAPVGAEAASFCASASASHSRASHSARAPLRRRVPGELPPSDQLANRHVERDAGQNAAILPRKPGRLAASAFKPTAFQLRSRGIGSPALEAPYALPKVHVGKRSDQALLRPVRGATAVALPGLRLRERAHCQILRWLWQADWGDRRSPSHHRRHGPVRHTHQLDSAWARNVKLSSIR